MLSWQSEEVPSRGQAFQGRHLKQIHLLEESSSQLQLPLLLYLKLELVDIAFAPESAFQPFERGREGGSPRESWEE